jgi:hypothetical protein
MVINLQFQTLFADLFGTITTNAILQRPLWFDNSILHAGTWILLAARVLSSTCATESLCSSDGWYGLMLVLLPASLLNFLLLPPSVFWQNFCV